MNVALPSSDDVASSRWSGNRRSVDGEVAPEVCRLAVLPRIHGEDDIWTKRHRFCEQVSTPPVST
jgi:hypothetical protein